MVSRVWLSLVALNLLLLLFVCLHMGCYVNEPNFSLFYIAEITIHSEGLLLQDKR